MTNKDIIKQYADTGICIPENQFNKFSQSLLKTYLRKRMIVVKEFFASFNKYTPSDYEQEVIIHPYEYEKLDNEQKKEYDFMDDRVKGWRHIRDGEERWNNLQGDPDSFDDDYDPIIQN